MKRKGPSPVTTPLPILNIVVSKTADSQHDYVQILSADGFSLNIVLIAGQVKIEDRRC